MENDTRHPSTLPSTSMEKSPANASNKYARRIMISAMARSAVPATVKMPRKLVEELYDASVKFASVIESLEVVMDKKTMRRIKTSRGQYSKGQYVVANGPTEIRKALSS